MIRGAIPSISRRPCGHLQDGRPVEEFTLDNGSGLRLCAINLGGIVTALQVPDRDGVAANIVLGLASLRDYATRNPHLGTIVGRYANRLAHCRFAIDGEVFQLHCNDGPHALHGGPQGFGSRWWDIEPAAPASDGSVGLVLRLRSEDGDQGFPGCLDATVRYTLTAQQCWRIDYTATCERSTVVNLSHHDYFNLAGGGDSYPFPGFQAANDALFNRVDLVASGTTMSFSTAGGEQAAFAWFMQQNYPRATPFAVADTKHADNLRIRNLAKRSGF